MNKILFFLICTIAVQLKFHDSYAQYKEFTNQELVSKLKSEVDTNKNYNNALYYLELLQENASKNSFDKFHYIYLAGLYYQNIGLFKESKEYLTQGIEEINNTKKISGLKQKKILLNQNSYKITRIETNISLVPKIEKPKPDVKKEKTQVSNTSKNSNTDSNSITLNQVPAPTINTAGQLVDEAINTAKDEIGKLVKFLTSDESSNKSDSLKSSPSLKPTEKVVTIKPDKKNKKDLSGDDMYEEKKKSSKGEAVKFSDDEVNNLNAAFNALLGKAYSLENELSLADQYFANASKMIKSDSIYDERDAITLLYIMENDLNFQQYKSFESNKAKLPINEKFCLSDSLKLTQFTVQYTKILGDYYFTIQDQKKALQIYRLAIKRYENFFGFHIDLPSLYVRVAEMEANVGEINAALTNLEYCRKLVARKIGKLNPEYAKLISTYAYIKDKLPNLKDKDKKENGAYHSAAVSTLNRLLGKENINYALAYVKLVNHINFYPLDSTLLIEETELLNSVALIEKTYQADHIESITAYSILTRYFFSKKQFKESSKYFDLVTDRLSSKIKRQVGLLNENELNNIIAFLKNEMRGLQSLALTEAVHFPKLNETIFESNILLKGLLLSSTQLMNFQSTTLGDKGAILFKIKNEISKAYSMNFTGLSVKIDSLELKLKEIEKEILLSQPDLAVQQAKLEVKSEQFQTILKQGEAILDFVLLPKNGKSGYTYFVNFIEKGQNVKLIKICDDNELRDYLVSTYQGAEKDSLTFVKRYGESGLNTKVKAKRQNSNKLYNIIFKPLESHISNKQKLYVSLDGELNKVSLSAISKDGNFIIDRFEMIQVMNPKTIITLNDVFLGKEEKTTLLGGISYDLNSITTENRGFKNAKVINTESNKKQYYLPGPWGYLGGTKTEVDKIFASLKDKKVEIISGKNATEDYIKSLNGKFPNFLHIASHGFSKEQDTLCLVPFISSENPMMRSGIILAGANKYWTTGNTKENEDGILTAYEVSSMNMSNVKLATLSACQTALGAISSDGVYGLQRAFKVAGTKQLLISLWEVSDLGTQLLMTEFYNNLSIGKNTREAFRLAQLKLKNNPKASPFWWSAFVLVE